MRPARLEPRRGAARARGSSSTTSKCVTASRGVSVSSEWRVGSRRSRPIGASIVPAARARAARRRARGTRARARAAGRAPAAAGTPPRCARRRAAPTCRGRAGGRSRAAPAPPPAPSRRASAVRRACRSRGPAPGWTTSPAGLSTTSRCSSSYGDPQLERLRRRAALGRGAAARTRAPPRPRAGGSSAARAPSTSTRAGREQPLGRRARADLGSAARKRSSRSPRGLLRDDAAASTHVRERRGSRSAATSAPSRIADADHDEAVGEVERRPVAEVEEVGDVAEPDAVERGSRRCRRSGARARPAAADGARRSGRRRRASRRPRRR